MVFLFNIVQATKTKKTMSTKTKKISVTNFKAIGKLEVDFNGCTAIVTAANDKGKTTLLRGISDRIRGLKPDEIVKQGEEQGNAWVELTTGEKFLWEFDNQGTDKLTFITKEGYQTSVTKEIVKRFYPAAFDIDKFVNSAPKEQGKQLQKIVGLDFTTIDARYKLAYEDRYKKNQESERFHVKLSSMLVCDYVEPVDLTELQQRKENERTRLNNLYLENKKINDDERTEWNRLCRNIDAQCNDYNNKQKQIAIVREKLLKAIHDFATYSCPLTITRPMENWVDENYTPLVEKIASQFYPKEPIYIQEMPDDKDLRIIDAEILTASETNTAAKQYQDYKDYKRSVDDAKEEALVADEVVKGIEEERQKMIESAKMPKGVGFAEDGGITVDGFALDKKQISTSKFYCAALRIGSINIGEVRTIHFDASFLDKNTLAEIETWAAENDLQLLIERADYDAGEIQYQLIEQ